ncbi:hypothetical protein LEN26_009899 [Aphanomyces euteiches]|nr:hypothetical protein LEN26_009899 [Aphanomyces euteiches]KAH9125673.1 hypothetical protein AeMF1_003746 [Aphanomyces euteiches]KAH9185166.1 hypothetical protein AeNC1_012858 [Aphanomyces euteiches]
MRQGRPISKYGAKKMSKEFKNVHMTYRKKYEIIQYYAEHGMTSTLNQHFNHLQGTSRSSTRKKIYAWLKQKEFIQTKATTPATANHKCARQIGMGTTLPYWAEEQLARWVNSLRIDRVQTAIDVGLQEKEFLASWHWKQGFMKRFRMSLRARTRVGQERQSDGEAVLDDFAKRAKACMLDNNIQVVYNADQTAVNYEYLPTKTINPKSSKTVWVRCTGKTKDLATAMILGYSEGRKYPLFLVFKTAASKVDRVVQENIELRNGFGIRIWRTMRPLEDQFRCKIHGNPKGWWNARLTIDFLRFHFGERQEMDKKVLLLLDHFSGHFRQDVLSYARDINFILMKIPAGYTWICQPADVAWIRPLKARLRQAWIDMIRHQIQVSKARQVPFKLEPPSRSTIVRWIKNSWSILPSRTILNGFAKCKLVEAVEHPPNDIPCAIEDDLLSELMNSSSIDEMIDPENDVDEVANEDIQEILL